MSANHARQKRKAGADPATTAKPASEQDQPFDVNGFVGKVLVALGLNWYELAILLNVSPNDVLQRTGARYQQSDWDTDPFWQQLLDYTDKRVAGLLAAKDALERKRRLDRRRRWDREQAIKHR